MVARVGYIVGSLMCWPSAIYNSAILFHLTLRNIRSIKRFYRQLTGEKGKRKISFFRSISLPFKDLASLFQRTVIDDSKNNLAPHLNSLHKRLLPLQGSFNQIHYTAPSNGIISSKNTAHRNYATDFPVQTRLKTKQGLAIERTIVTHLFQNIFGISLYSKAADVLQQFCRPSSVLLMFLQRCGCPNREYITLVSLETELLFFVHYAETFLMDLESKESTNCTSGIDSNVTTPDDIGILLNKMRKVTLKRIAEMHNFAQIGHLASKIHLRSMKLLFDIVPVQSESLNQDVEQEFDSTLEVLDRNLEKILK